MKRILKKKAVIIASIALIILIILIALSCVLSYSVLKVRNPFAAGIGIVKVMYTDTEYVVVQKNPKIVFAKGGEYSLETHMESEGYTKTHQDGALYTFEKDGEETRIYTRVGHFAKWYWE